MLAYATAHSRRIYKQFSSVCHITECVYDLLPPFRLIFSDVRTSLVDTFIFSFTKAMLIWLAGDYKTTLLP